MTSQVGQAIRTTSLGTAASDKNGNYRFHGHPTLEMLTEAAQHDGWLNFTLISRAGSKYTIEYFSRHWEGTGWTEYGNDRPGMSPGDGRELAFVTDAKSGEARYGILNNASGSTRVEPLAGCVQIVTKTTINNTNIIEFHNSSDADGKWEYGETADSDIDIGVSYNGGTSYGANGTGHVSNSLGSKIGGTTSSNFGKYIASQFKYQHGYYSSPCTNTLFIRPAAWNGGTTYAHDVSQYDCNDSPQSSYSTYYEKGTNYTKNASRAITFGIGADLGVFKAKSTSGYSTKVDMSWHWARNWGYLCGSNDYPPRAKVVYAY